MGLKCVAGFLRETSTDAVVCIRKRKPDWQKNKLNGVGGKCEIISQERRPGGKIVWKDPLDCMRREWLEEMNVEIDIDWKLFATQYDGDVTVYFFKGEIEKFPKFPSVNDANEPIEEHAIDFLIDGQEDIVSNLVWLLPLAFREKGNVTVQANCDRRAA